MCTNAPQSKAADVQRGTCEGLAAIQSSRVDTSVKAQACSESAIVDTMHLNTVQPTMFRPTSRSRVDKVRRRFQTLFGLEVVPMAQFN
eukprot:4382336-Amphidinium_carterae.2